jgi:hypothetical protein
MKLGYERIRIHFSALSSLTETSCTVDFRANSKLGDNSADLAINFRLATSPRSTAQSTAHKVPHRMT